MATHGGEADAYYKGQPQQQYPMQPYDGNGPMNNGPGYQQNGASNYQQGPPVYGSGPQYGEGAAPLVDGKQTFDQAFKLDKPKYNDIWAGILV